MQRQQACAKVEKAEHHAGDDNVVLQAQHFIGSAELLRQVLCLARPLDDVVPYEYGSVLDLLMVVGEGRQRFNLLMRSKTLSAMNSISVRLGRTANPTSGVGHSRTAHQQG